ncbi:unannotated protein [freshwater metagenome]|uniref:Unannotated protein n=1 Tax=freshwater metagenome TaxID=449393 RepID=A0A6J7IPR5_9ZZZZ
MPRGSDDLAEVVGDEVRGHADRDAGGTIDEQVRNRCRQHGGFCLAAVVVRIEVDDIFVEARSHAQCCGGQPGLGVAHGGRAVIGGAEIPVPVDHGQTQGEGLGHAYQGVVDRGVAVGVESAHDLADDASTLHMAAIRAQAHLCHLKQDPALHGLEAVAGIRQRSRVDDRVGIFEEGGSHLLRDVDIDDSAVTGRS